MLERTLRTSPVTGIRLDPVLTAVLLAELLAPSDEAVAGLGLDQRRHRDRQHAR